MNENDLDIDIETHPAFRCPKCERPVRESDFELVQTYRGDTLSPPEYELVCPHCGKQGDLEVDFEPVRVCDGCGGIVEEGDEARHAGEDAECLR